MQFRYFLAEKLGRFVEEIDKMNVVEYLRWQIHFKRQAQAERDAIEDAKRGRR